MVDSTNPRVIADNIKELAAREAGSTVEANPTGAATADLEKLGVDGTIYGITSVEANPEEEATNDLEKLGVGGTVYGIPTYTPPDFSTTEVDTGIKWIDGSPIYCKVYTPASAIQLSTQGLGTDITSIITNVSDIGLIIEASAHLDETSLCLPISADISNGSILAYTFVNATADSIILKYTKTASE